MDRVMKDAPLRHTFGIYKSEEGEEQDLIRGKSPPIRKKRNRDPPLNEECRSMSVAPRKNLIHECRMMFLPFGRNNGKGTIMKMYDGLETYSSVPILMLVVAPSNTTKKNEYRSRKDVY